MLKRSVEERYHCLIPSAVKVMINRKEDTIRQKRSSFQTKEQDKNTQNPLNDNEISNLPEKEFRLMIVKLIQDLWKRMETQMENLKEMFNKQLEDLKSKMNSAIAEMKNNLEGTNSRLTQVEERISEMEDSVVEIKRIKKKEWKKLKSLRDILDNIKCTDIHIIGVPEGEEREKGAGNIFDKIMAEKSP